MRNLYQVTPRVFGLWSLKLGGGGAEVLLKPMARCAVRGGRAGRLPRDREAGEALRLDLLAAAQELSPQRLLHKLSRPGTRSARCTRRSLCLR